MSAIRPVILLPAVLLFATVLVISDIRAQDGPIISEPPSAAAGEDARPTPDNDMPQKPAATTHDEADKNGQAPATASESQAPGGQDAQPQATEPQQSGTARTEAGEGAAQEAKQPEQQSSPAVSAPAAPASAQQAPQKQDEARGENPPAGQTETPSQAGQTQPELAPAAMPKPEPAKPARPEDITLTIATWKGGYMQSQEFAYFKPFATKTRHKVRALAYDGTYADLRGQAAAGSEDGATGGDPTEDAKNGSWDVVDLGSEMADRACKEGLIEPIDPSILAPASAADDAPEAAAKAGEPSGETGQGAQPQSGVETDFLPGALRKCAIASVAWSAAILYDKRRFRKKAPKSVADLFDRKRFPGKRAFPKGPRYVLEMALMADGIAPDQVYQTLSTPEGQDRAFTKLAQLGSDILWWEDPAAPLVMIRDGRATMGLGYNGRAFAAIVGARAPFGLIWDGQIYDFDLWAIPKSAPHPKIARAFIRFATTPKQLAAQARWFPYGPARRSALALVGRHAEVDIAMAPFLPTAPENLAHSLAFDGAWWAEHGPVLKARFDRWLADEAAQAAKAAAEKADGLPELPQPRGEGPQQ